MRPTISLCLIAKNEEINVPVLFDSIKGCFDHIVFVDTGSTDRTVATAEEWAGKIGTPISIHHFEWVKDFAKARNFSLDQVKTEYAMWMDLDDSMGNPEAFKAWRDEAMQFADFWLATYNYTLDPQTKKPLVKFLRERVFKMSFKPRFKYFIHEGVEAGLPGVRASLINTWWIDHRRTVEEMMRDHGRNLEILELNKATFDGRLWFYYGKELYENGKPEEALKALLEAVTRKDIFHHDKILGYQFAVYAAMAVADKMKPEFQAEKLGLATNLAHLGLQLDPRRAEFYQAIGECYTRQGKFLEAAPYFSACKVCGNPNQNEKTSSAIFNFQTCYQDLPRINLAKIWFNVGEIDKAEKEARECFDLYPTNDAKILMDEVLKVKPLIKTDGPRQKTEEIVFTCPPQSAYEFDSELYKTKGMGGSETALIEMSTWLRKLTGRPVKIFNMRSRDFVDENGVEWISTSKLNEYFSIYSPKVHIAWRHNVKLTEAPTYLWCHDLVTQTCDLAQHFDYMLCLSPFHKRYVMAMQGIPENKIILTRNGITPDKFKFDRPVKDPNKIVWLSSPDRGLDRAMKVLDIVRERYPDIKLHVYYGLDNLYKYNMAELAEKLKAMMNERKDWVIYHGFTEQKKMTKDISDAVIWCHPCDFIETYAITALETTLLGIYPVTRRLGALPYTLEHAEKNHHALLLDHDCITPEEHLAYAKATMQVLENKGWEGMNYDPDEHSWENVAKSWLKFLPV